MASTTNTIDPTVNRTRVGGLLLAVGAVLWAVSFSMWSFGIAPELTGATPAERAPQLVGVQQLVQSAGWIGAFADVLIVAGALFLVTRPLATRNAFPASAFWLVVAVGGVVSLGSNLVWGNAMVPIAAGIGAATPAPGLVTTFEAIETTIGVSFSIAFLVVFAGIALALFGETRAADAAIPAWASWTGIAGGAVVGVASLLVLFGIEAAGIGFLAAFLPGLAALYLGIRVAFPGFMAAGTTTTTAAAATGRTRKGAKA